MGTNTSTATKTVSGAKLAIATLAMLGAGSVALATMPLDINSATYKWGGCADPDSYVDQYSAPNPFTPKQLFTKSNTYYNTGAKSDYCYTFPTTGKTYLMEGICRNNRFSTWQKNCAELNSTKPGSNFKCVEGVCVDVPNYNSDSSYGYGWQPNQNDTYGYGWQPTQNDSYGYGWSNNQQSTTSTNAQMVSSTALIISNLITNQLDGVGDSVYPLQNGAIEVGRLSFFNPLANSVKLKSLTIKETKTNVYTRNWYLKNSDNNIILSTGSKSGDMIIFNDIDYNFENKGNVIIYATVAMGAQNAATLNLKLQGPNAVRIIYNDSAQVAVFGNTFPYTIRTLQK